MSTTSLIEELPKIVKEGRQEAQHIIERLSNNARIGLQTNELVLPAKDTSGLWKGKNEQVVNKEWMNRLIYGDNLLAMQALLAGDEATGLPSLRGRVDLVHILMAINPQWKKCSYFRNGLIPRKLKDKYCLL